MSFETEVEWFEDKVKKLNKQVAELEKERDALVVRVTNCEQIFSDAPDLEFSRFEEMFPNEFEAHNLEQQAKGIEDFGKWVLDTDKNASGLDVRDIDLIESYIEHLNNHAKAPKEQE